jgi:hypothetical protein
MTKFQDFLKSYFEIKITFCAHMGWFLDYLTKLSIKTHYNVTIEKNFPKLLSIFAIQLNILFQIDI